MRKIVLLLILIVIILSCDKFEFINPYDTNVIIPEPTNLRIVSTKSSITIKWNDNSTGEEGFIISRKINQGSWDDDYYTLPTENATEFIDNNSQTVNTYSYKVRAYAGNNTSSYSNTVVNEGNLPPNQPSNPSPSNNETNVSINANLTWTCIDPEGDPLTYDVYFGTSTNPSIINNGQSETTYSPSTLEPQTTYHWKIVAHDDHSNSTTGDIWQFTTFVTGTVTDIDGNVYTTIIIGNQEWMAENLKVTHYGNGDAIPHLTDDNDWTNTTSGAYCYYNNSSSNADTYGALYNWHAVDEDDNRGLAPEGWHVPTDDDWKELEMYLGMTQAQADDTGYRGTNEGSKLAGNADLWYNGALENNTEFGSSGYSALPGGYRDNNSGNFYNIGYYADFWSSTEYYSNNAWYRKLNYNNSEVNRYYYNKKSGFSVRCIRD